MGKRKRVKLSVIEAVGLDDIAIVDSGECAACRIIAHERALFASGRAAAEVHLAVIHAYVVKILADRGAVKLGAHAREVDRVQAVAYRVHGVVALIQAVVCFADLDGDAVVFEVCLVCGPVGVDLGIVALAQRRLNKARDDRGYLAAAGRARSAEAIGRVHTDHYAGGIELFDRGLIIAGDAAQIADGVVADLRHILIVDRLGEQIREVIAVDALAELAHRRGCRGQHAALGAVSVIGHEPCLVLARLGNEIVVIRGVDARGYRYGLGPADVVVRAEGLVRIAEHDALVIGGLDAGIAPCF